MTVPPQVGDALQQLVARPTSITLFRFSAVTWNPHRIHYDAPYAATEGYPGPLVQSHLHGAFLFEAVRRGLPEGATILTFGWRNRAPAILRRWRGLARVGREGCGRNRLRDGHGELHA
jgi:hydroxyacyl-ACP dehydratase HTD2-like protein with hotdog domain